MAMVLMVASLDEPDPAVLQTGLNDNGRHYLRVPKHARTSDQA